jgi:hypothetical protein
MLAVPNRNLPTYLTYYATGAISLSLSHRGCPCGLRTEEAEPPQDGSLISIDSYLNIA